MHFHSTRNTTQTVTLSEAITAGIAPDGGLYVPQTLPRFSINDFDHCETLNETGTRLLSPFFEGDPLLASALPTLCRDAFNFPTPLQPSRVEGVSILELFHGPTAAFKDIGARFLAACMSRLRTQESHQESHQESQSLTILVATSGDTGAAVAAAFHRMPGLRVIILYPDGRVSPRQAHQLGCFGDNIHTFKVAGSFDDCQRLVKQALGDTELQIHRPLSSANSISLGRLLPQMTYYAHAAITHYRTHALPLNFVIPTGNLGNALAAIFVKAMNLPIGRIVLATNANRVLPDFFAGDAYQPRTSISTLANAMDVGDPSNFERLRWLYPDEQKLRSEFEAFSIEDEAIRCTIRDGQARYGHLFCPHTATAISALERLEKRNRSEPWAIVATAHPAKFESIVEPLIGQKIPVPPALANLLARPSHAEPMRADYRSFITASFTTN